MLSLAFVFLLVGYGTKVGLVPLHNWLPDAHAEGPTPVSAVLSGLLLNVALYAVVRCKVLVEGSLQHRVRRRADDGLRPAVGGASRRSSSRGRGTSSACSRTRRSSTWASSPSPSAWAARSRTSPALLHMTVHSLTKSAIFFAVGHAAQKAGTQVMDDIRGLITISPTVGWGLMLGTLAILGMPPFGVFASEFLILTTAMREQPWATPFLLRRSASRSPRSSAGCSRWCSARRTAAAAASAGADSGVRASGARADAGPVHSAVPRRLVPAGGAADRMSDDAPRSIKRCRLPRHAGRAPARRAPRREQWSGAGRSSMQAGGATLRRAVGRRTTATATGLPRSTPRSPSPTA